MKITVEMSVDDFAEFMKFRESKQHEERRLAELQRKTNALVRAVYSAVDVDEKEQTAQLMSYENAVKLVRLADEV